MTYIYLHGFASSPRSRKARFFSERFAELGLPLAVPDLAPDFFNLTITGQIEIVRETAGSASEVTLIGSSMGGYVAALCASVDARVRRVVLLAPAFGFGKRWPESLGAERVAEWRRTGEIEVFHYGDGVNRRLGYQLVTDAGKYPDYPVVGQPALICHGRQDTVVPDTVSIEFASRNPATLLVLADSGHEMTEVLDDLWRETAAFLQIGAAAGRYKIS